MKKQSGFNIDNLQEYQVLPVMAFNSAFRMWKYKRMTYDKADLMAMKETFLSVTWKKGIDVNVYLGIIKECRRRPADVETMHNS